MPIESKTLLVARNIWKGKKSKLLYISVNFSSVVMLVFFVYKRYRKFFYDQDNPLYTIAKKF